MSRTPDDRFAVRLRGLLERSGVSYRALAARSFYAKSYLHELATGRKAPTRPAATRLDEVLLAGGSLLACLAPKPAGDDELAAVELARRVDATDVSNESLTRIEQATDELAMAYATTPPQLLLPRLREHLSYVARLVDGRATLAQRRRILVAGGWLSLLAATVHLDLREQGPAEARLTTAGQLAGHADHPEILAWCAETRAWNVLTEGDYARAVDLSRQAQGLAPRGSSALIQATAQEGRAWARMGDAANTRAALARVEHLVGPLSMPEHPEHHYRYDPGKALAYTATTLSWVGDPAAEEYARTALAELQAGTDRVTRPRRVASAQLDLALALLHTGRADEAGAVAVQAVESGRVVASNWWRATEVLHGVERADVGEARQLRDAYEAFRPTGNP